MRPDHSQKQVTQANTAVQLRNLWSWEAARNLLGAARPRPCSPAGGPSVAATKAVAAGLEGAAAAAAARTLAAAVERPEMGLKDAMHASALAAAEEEERCLQAALAASAQEAAWLAGVEVVELSDDDEGRCW